ncbi:type II toxin-antitoxin system death-on-curing family toxin [Paraclostridium bifermentans]
MRSLTKKQLLTLHTKVINASGGSDGVRDEGLIDSALDRHKATFGGEDLYTSVEEKIAVTTHSLIANHGFIDGNKRIGVIALDVLSTLNNIKLEYEQKDMIELGLKVAQGAMNEEDILDWIKRHEK